MSTSLLNTMLADKVTALLDEAAGLGTSRERAISREDAEAAIHAILWTHASAGGSTASAYAWCGLMDALGLRMWEFKDSAPSTSSDAPGAE